MTTPAHLESLEAARDIRHALHCVAPLTRDGATAALHTVGAELRNLAYQMTLAVDSSEWPLIARRVCALAAALDGSATATKEESK